MTTVKVLKSLVIEVLMDLGIITEESIPENLALYTTHLQPVVITPPIVIE